MKQKKPRYTAEAAWIGFMEEAAIIMHVNVTDPPNYEHYMDLADAVSLRDDLNRAIREMPKIERQHRREDGKRGK